MLTDLNTLKSLLSNYDIISFDVFDTLLVRPVTRPEFVFDFIAPSSGAAFRTARIRAEEAARRLKRLRYGHSEVTLNEIYERFTGSYINSATPKDEFKTEKALLTSRKTGFELYCTAKSMNKRVIAISDSYFDDNQIRHFLEHLNIYVDQIYTSSSTTGGKYDGHLFKEMLETEMCEPHRILHFGDNRDSDFLEALRIGIHAVYIPKNTELLFRDSSYNLAAIDSIINTKSTFGSFVVSRLADRRERGLLDAAVTRFSALFGGPLVFCYAKWLADKVRELELNHLFLVARDGILIKEVLGIIAPEINTTVLRLSRRACLVASLAIDMDALTLLLPADIGASPREILTKLFENAGDLIAECEKAGIDTSENIRSIETSDQIRNVIRRNRALIAGQVEREFIGLRRYLTSENFPDAKGALVDTGWGLSSHRAIEKLIGKKVHGLYLGTNKNAYHHDSIDAMLTLRGSSPAWDEILESAVELLELPYISDVNQVERFVANEDNFKIEERKPDAFEINRRIIAPEVQREILSFCREATSMNFSESTSDMVSVLLAAFNSLAKSPTPIEHWTLGEVLHDRYVHAGQYQTISHFVRSGGSRNISASTAQRVRGSFDLLSRYRDLARGFGFYYATVRALGYAKRRLKIWF